MEMTWRMKDLTSPEFTFQIETSSIRHERGHCSVIDLRGAILIVRVHKYCADRYSRKVVRIRVRVRVRVGSLYRTYRPNR